MSLTCGNCYRDVPALDKKRGWCRACNEKRADEAAPDRPGDRDQQQAAEAIPNAQDRAKAWAVLLGGRSDWEFAARKADSVAAALAAARAEEAARWQAKIKALAEELDAEQKREMSHYSWGVRDTTARFCALLDGEQR